MAPIGATLFLCYICYMKTIAFILNFVVFGTFFFLAAEEGFDFFDSWEAVLFLVVLLTPLLNNYLLFKLSLNSGKKSRGFFSTYMERKRLEEEVKIKKLSQE